MPTAEANRYLSTNDGEIALQWVHGGHGIMHLSGWSFPMVSLKKWYTYSVTGDLLV